MMIDVLVNEHDNIKIVLEAVRKNSIELMNGKEVDDELYRNIIDFVRNYADKYHHQKEEKQLFNKMPQEGPVQGMLLEHDMGRKYILNLENALNEYKNGNKDSKVNIIAYGIAYRDLLADHINKEDNVIYKFAMRVINDEDKKIIEKDFKHIEEAPENIQIKDKYISFVQSLKQNFNI